MGELRKAKKRKKIIEWAVTFAAVIITAFIFRNFIFGTAVVKGASMEPEFEHNDTVFVNKLAYTVGSPKRGDVVICWYDKGTDYETIIKRVIGLPGDVIDVEKDADYNYFVVLNGERLDEGYIKEPMEQIGDIEYPFTVPENSYFVMGDNRNNSNDSRSQFIGAVPEDQIDGKIAARIFPLGRFKIF